MKKIFMTLAAAVVAVSASAQVYLGGNFGVSSQKVNDNDSKTAYAVLPEIGYNLNNDWAIGTTVGFGKGNPMSIIESNSVGLRNYFTVQPYARYTFVHSKYVNVFADLGFGYTHYNHADAATTSINAWQVGLKPGVEVNLNERLSFVAHVGMLGWQQAKYKDSDSKVQEWGADFNGNNLTFGLYYNF